MDKALDRAVEAAMREAAARAVMPRFTPGHAIASVFKTAGEAVTEADREAEAILAERLAPLLPGAALVGEEAAHADPALLAHLGQGTTWIVDPIDGTGNFAAGLLPFGILVALARDGVPVAGWILDPVSGRFCTGWADHGATIDGEAVQQAGARPGPCSTPRIAVTKLFARPAERDRLVASLAGEADVTDSPRCAADQYPRIAQGRHDASVFTRTLAWDHAAGVVFLNASGGLARRPDGSPYRCDGASGGLIAATTPRIWDAVAAGVSRSGIDLASAAPEA